MNAQLRELFLTPMGIKVLVNDLVTTDAKRIQVRFPRSRKKRIRRKWAKRPENFKVKMFYRAIMVDNTLYVHSTMYAAFKKKALETLKNHAQQTTR